jgi:hypothetical protein
MDGEAVDPRYPTAIGGVLVLQLGPSSGGWLFLVPLSVNQCPNLALMVTDHYGYPMTRR